MFLRDRISAGSPDWLKTFLNSTNNTITQFKYNFQSLLRKELWTFYMNCVIVLFVIFSKVFSQSGKSINIPIPENIYNKYSLFNHLFPKSQLMNKSITNWAIETNSDFYISGDFTTSPGRVDTLLNLEVQKRSAFWKPLLAHRTIVSPSSLPILTCIFPVIPQQARTVAAMLTGLFQIHKST